MVFEQVQRLFRMFKTFELVSKLCQTYADFRCWQPELSADTEACHAEPDAELGVELEAELSVKPEVELGAEPEVKPEAGSEAELDAEPEVEFVPRAAPEAPPEEPTGSSWYRSYSVGSGTSS